jgi:hypothetical protein
MKPGLFLRIASVLTFLHCVLHTVGGVFGKPKHGIEEVAVIETMKEHAFNVVGSMRTYWDFFFGYGLFVTVNLLLQAILFWALAGYVKTSPGLVRIVALLFFFNYALMSIIAFRYFFIAPGVVEALTAVCLLVAYFTVASA